MAEHNDLGDRGEKIAQKFLKDKGYIILETNWQFGPNEIDIIARNNGYLVIVEVKTRSSAYYGDPEIFVNRKKQSFLIRAANVYIGKKHIQEETRFDVVAVLLTSNDCKINHLKDAFYPTL